tara:strand:+ start:461 stop:2077 length:1617 start_codon:yes stop_codon:yes gene_type:complete
MAINNFGSLIEEEEYNNLLNQAFNQAGAQALAPSAPVRDVRAERLAAEGGQAPVMQGLQAEQQAIRDARAAQLAAMTNVSEAQNQTPGARFATEGQTLGQAFRNPNNNQRAAMRDFGLSLLSSSGSTQNLSSRLGIALGSGAQALQAGRQAGIEQETKAQQLALQQANFGAQAASQDLQFGQQTRAAEAAQIEVTADRLQQARDNAFKQQQYDLDVLKFENPTPPAPGAMEKRQIRRRDLQVELANLEAADQPDPIAIAQVNNEINEINAANAPKATLNPTTGLWEKPSTMGSSKPTQLTKQTIDLTGSITGASQIAKQGMNLVYDPIQDEIFGRIQNFPTIAGAYESLRALGNPEISQFIEAKNRFRVSAMLPFARTLAPVTDIDAAKLEKTKGLLEAGNRNAQIKEWEGKSLPDLAQLIFDSNINYKVGDTGGEEGGVYGPQVAAQNQLIFAESSLNGALEGQGYAADQSMAEKNERTNRLLDMYPSTGVSRNLSGADGVYSYKGKVVSQNFIDKISKGYGLTPADFIRYSEISAY